MRNRNRVKPEDRPLNPQQLRFVQEYLSDPSNKTKAAIRAGYSPVSARAIANDFLKDVRIAKIVKDRQNQVIKKTGITEDRIIQELIKIAFATPGQTITLDAEGEPDINLIGLSPEDAAGLEIQVNTVGTKDKKVKTVTVKTVRTSDRIAALEKLGKHLGMFADKLEVKTTVSLADLIEKSFKIDQPKYPVLEVINQPTSVSGPITLNDAVLNNG